MSQAWGLQKPLRTRSEPHKGRIWGRHGQSLAKLLTCAVGESAPGGPWVHTGFMWQRGLGVCPSPPVAVLLGPLSPMGMGCRNVSSWTDACCPWFWDLQVGSAAASGRWPEVPFSPGRVLFGEMGRRAQTQVTSVLEELEGWG